jgi:ribosomal protein S10
MKFNLIHNSSYSIQLKSFNLKTLRKSIQKFRYLYKRKFFLKGVSNKRNQMRNYSFGSLRKKYFRKKKVGQFLYTFVYLKNYILHRFAFCFYKLVYFTFSKHKSLLTSKEIGHSSYLSLKNGNFLSLQQFLYYYVSSAFPFFVRDKSHIHIGILPSKRRCLTILRSPHVDKKSREQYELIIYRRVISINLSGPDDLMKIRPLLESMGNFIEGVGYRIVERNSYYNYLGQ